MTTNEKDPQTILRNAMESFLSDTLEALTLLVEEEVAKTHSEPEPDLREFLHDSIPVGHGWVVDEDGDGDDLFKLESDGFFTRWTGDKWGAPSHWEEPEMSEPRPATVGDLRRKSVPLSEWPNVETSEPEPDPREDLSNDMLVGHGWVVDGDLFKPEGDGRFTLWSPRLSAWGNPGFWMDHDLRGSYLATVGDLRRVGLPLSEWPDIETQENA